MAKTKITMENISDFINTLPYAQFKALVESYATHSKTNFDDEMKQLVTVNLQSRLEKLGVNSTCPQCGSAIVVKNGKRSNGIQDINVRNAATDSRYLQERFWRKHVGIGMFGLRF